MASCMTDSQTPTIEEESTTDEDIKGAPRVRVLLTVVEGSDLDAALSVVGRQVYDPAPEVVVVGDVDTSKGVTSAESLEQAISDTSSDVDYLWLLHSDARPRPDALRALVEEVERADASLGGSKLLVAGTQDILESVGSATDVFGEPYSGLDEGEIDLQQYDVVREVAFVSSTSMLVRRDLAQGLRGLDVLLPPVAAGLDFSQRTRLAGGRVISVPSSEVYHQARCEGRFSDWREQAGRLRAVSTAYSLLTLIWLVPYDFLVSILDSVASLLLLRWRPPVRHLLSWGWNLVHLPSLVVARLRFRKVRSLGDEELFRFQARGSIRLRTIGEELSGRLLSIFDEDQALARGTRRLWGSPGIWGAVLAVAFVAFAARTVIFIGVPNIGSSFPFEPPSLALDRFLAGWNEAGLGSSSAVHPAVGLTGLGSLLWFGAEGAARTVMTVGFGFFGIVGMGRLAGRLGFRGPGRYLSGLVLLAGPGVAALTENGSWLALGAAAALPWAVRATFVHPDEKSRGVLSHVGWALLFGIPVAAFSPALAVVPLLTAILWKVWGGKHSSLWLGVLTLVGVVVAVPFILSDNGWLLDFDRRFGLAFDGLWAVLIGLGFLPLVLADRDSRRFGGVGAVLGLGGLALSRVPYGGPGVEEATLVLASFGAALVVGAGLNAISRQPRQLMAALASSAILALSVGPLVNGRLGLPAGDVNERYAFASALAPANGPGRILIASADRQEIPGEARSGPGYWYRTIDGQGTTLDEVWLPGPLSGDVLLESSIEVVTSGSQLEPGAELAPFAIDWVILVGPAFRLDEVLVAQLDLVPTPLDPASRVFENPRSVPLADSGFDDSWNRDGTGFSGDSEADRVDLAINYAGDWSPAAEQVNWYTTVDADEGYAGFRGDALQLSLALAAGAVLLAGSVLIAIGRLRR